MSAPGNQPRRLAERPLATLALISFASLFLELVMIRYVGSQIRVFSFYRNIPLIACFLGLGLGCWKGGGGSRHVLVFLAGLVPVTLFLAHGTTLVDGFLGRSAAVGSSEHILGDVVASDPATLAIATAQAVMAGVAVTTLVVIAVLFILLGRILGAAFEPLPRVTAYTVNVSASLAGVIAFIGLSLSEVGPAAWFVVGSLPLLWWLDGGRRLVAAGGLILMIGGLVVVEPGQIIWSRYQKLAVEEIPAGPDGTGIDSPGFLVQISDVFYQVALDLRPAAWAARGAPPFPHYDAAFDQLRGADRVLVVGSGTGNDVAAALRAGVEQVDAVDIDPAILDLGRRLHPEQPYADPRVTTIVADARRLLRRLPRGSYDAVVFGLLDSHTQLGMSSVRLDNYVFTRESFAEAASLLAPDGQLVMTAATFRPWFEERFRAMLGEVCAQPVDTRAFGNWVVYRCREVTLDAADDPSRSADIPTDDWPFLYLESRGVPTAYLVVLSALMLASVAILRGGGLRLHRMSDPLWHFFFLGAAFLLMEVQGINRLALLFGTTWLVSAVTVTLVLLLIVAANLTVAVAPRIPVGPTYAVLIVSLVVAFAVPAASVLHRPVAWSIAFGVLVLSPVYFAGIVFVRSFAQTPVAGPAFGANMLGSVLGAWAEYSTMAIGIRSMALLALVFYLASLVFWLRSPTRGTA